MNKVRNFSEKKKKIARINKRDRMKNFLNFKLLKF